MMIRHLMGVVVCVFISTAAFSQICTDPLTVTIEGSSTGETLSVSCEGTNPLCNVLNGDPSGEIDATVIGGTTPYNYAWTGTGTVAGIEDQTGLGAGSYTLVVTDANNCTGECMVTLTEPAEIVFTGTPDNPACFADNTGQVDGGIVISGISGGTVAGDYDFAWSGPGVDPTSQNQTNLGAGTYTVTVTDDNGCEATDEFVLTEPLEMTVALDPTDPDCHANNTTQVNGEINATITNGVAPYSYEWTGLGTADADGDAQTGLGGGAYTVIVTDASGCTAEAMTTLAEPAELALDATEVNPDCNSIDGSGNGTITINNVANSIAPYTYAWTGPGVDATAENQVNLGAGAYAVTITDGNGCTIEGQWTLTEPNPMALAFTPIDPLCNANNTTQVNGSVSVDVTNGTAPFSYVWSGPGITAANEGTQTVTNLGAGTYVVVVTDALGCEISDQTSLSEPAEIVFTGTPDNPACFADNTGQVDGGIVISGISGGTVAGDYDFAWTGPGVNPTSQNQTNLGAGTYNVTVTDDNGCEATEEFVLTEPLEMTVALDPTDPPCNIDNTDQVEGAITANISNGIAPFTYTWTGPGTDDADQGTQTQLGGGFYSVVVTDASGCTAEADVTLVEPPVIAFFAVATQLTCHADSYPPGEGGDGTITIDQVVGGTVAGDYDFAWTGPGVDPTAQNQSGLEAGTYNVTISDDNGCEITGEYVLTQPDPVTVDGDITPLLCNSDSGAPSGEIVLTAAGGTPLANGGYNYNWAASGGGALSDPATSKDQTGLSAGTYTVTVTDENGCEVVDMWTLGEPDAVSCGIDATDILCNGDLATITVTPAGGTGPYTYVLNGTTAGTTTDATGNPIPPATVGPTSQDDPNNTFQVEAGTYTVTTIDANGCESTCDITIDQPTLLVAGTCVQQDECQVDAGEIQVCADQGVGPYTISWNSTTGGTLIPPGGGAPAVSGSVTDVVDCVTFTGAQGGETYVFTVTDANGCTVP